MTLATVLPLAIAGAATGAPWEMFGGTGGRSSFAIAETGGPPLALAWKATAAADQGVWTSPIITQGARRLVAYGTQTPPWMTGPTSKGNVHVRDLQTGAPVGPADGVNVDDGPGDNDTFGSANKASVSFVDSSAPGGAPGQLFVLHNDDSDADSQVAIAQIDEATGAVVQDVAVPRTPKFAAAGAKKSGQNGSDVSGSPAVQLDDAGNGVMVFRVGLPVYDSAGTIVGKVENVHVVPLRNARSRSAVIDVGHQLITPDFQATSRTSPTLVTLADPASGQPTTYIAMGTSEPGSSHYVKTFRVSDLKPGPVSDALSGWGQTVSVPLTAAGLSAGSEGSGVATAPYLVVAGGDGSSGWVYKLVQEGSRLAVANSVKIAGHPSPGLATNALVGPGALADGRVVVAASKNLYVLRASDLSVEAKLRPSDDLDKGCAPCDTKGRTMPPRDHVGFYIGTPVIARNAIYVARDDGTQLVLDLDSAQPVAAADFTQDPANESSTFTRGEPAIGEGMAVFASVNGIFAYRMNATSGGGGGDAGERVFGATEDASIKSTRTKKNSGNDKALKVVQAKKRGKDTYRAYLKFVLSGLPGPVARSRLRLWVKDASADAGQVFAVSDPWTESTIAWGNAPALGGAVGTLGKTGKGRWVDVDLGTAVTGNGTYSFALATTSTDSAGYDSSEGSHKPQLVVLSG